ncbi:redoxin domain-containing protein [Sphingobacterium oryzagri]|uniref:Redoxin domain-containing protein n=1 Tax=Sphingobacterium oryzagri TaxID=3025669 RepID=A0ABY7WF37_9SPHI|nr:redoxin domain-containing protein [Sphingobacterium sp. KACC 22765]WDF67224.1 redoxin domain-containing protein [Sphingobacterium sp. KACC 22765]
MKYFFSSIALGAMVSFSACQSGNKENTTQQTEQQAAADPHAHAGAQPTAQQAPAMAKDPAKSIPEFTFYKVKSGIGFSKADIPANRNTAFILFDPSCGHCQHEASLLAKNYAKVKDVNIYFVSMNDPALMASFLETFAKELVDKPNVEVLYDRNQQFIQKFHVPVQFPANYIYGADGQLKNSWDGEKEIGYILAEYSK